MLRAAETLLVTLEDLLWFLEYLDSSLSDWHTARGLPQRLAAESDLIAMTRAHRDESSVGYFQEYALLGMTADGYGLRQVSVGSQTSIISLSTPPSAPSSFRPLASTRCRS